MGQAQPLAGWCWVFSVVHAQMGPCSYIELRVWRCRTNRRTHHSDMPRTSGTYRNTWTDGFGCRHTMLAECHHCQHLKMWIPSKRRRRTFGKIAFGKYKHKIVIKEREREREREKENLFDFALRTDTIIRLIIHKKNH